MKHALVVMPVTDEQKAYLEEIGTGCEFHYSTINGVTAEEVKAADILIGNADPQLVKQAEHLEWMQLNSAGADPYCKPGIISDGTFLTGATGAYGLSVSEYMVTVSLMMCRKMDLYAQNQGKNLWQKEGAVTSVWGSTTLILGLGDIGSEYAKRMKAMGSYVIGIRRNLNKKPEYLDEIHTMDELDELLGRADFVMMVLPSTKETHYLMDERRLRLMKKGSYLINVGRGDAIEPKALNKIMREGNILGGCALDVTEPEPLPADDPLWTAPRVFITPHIAGGFFLQETLNRIVRIAGENMKKFLAGEGKEMRNLVDPKTGSVSNRIA